MAWFRRKGVEKRAIDYPFNVGPPGFNPVSTDQDQALGLPAFYAGVRLLADSVASSPLQVFRDTQAGRVRVGTSWLDDPSVKGSQFDWVVEAVVSLAVHGNAVGMYTGMDGYGFPTGCEWLNPTHVHLDETKAIPRYYYLGREVPREMLLHVRWLSVPGSWWGLSPIRAHAITINAGISATRYGADWFGNGGVPPGTFKNSASTVDPADGDTIKARLLAAIRSRQPLVYGKDWDYNALAVPPEESQFIETMRLNATQVAAILGVPPDRVGGSRGDSMTYKTQEQDEIAFSNGAVRHWCTRLERALNKTLPNRQFVKFNLDAGVRADLLTRYQAHQISRTIGLNSIDELRALEDLAPLPNGEGADYDPLPVLQAEAQQQLTSGAMDETDVGEPAPPTRLRPVAQETR